MAADMMVITNNKNNHYHMLGAKVIKFNFTYIFCVSCSGDSLVTNICISFVFDFCGGGEPSSLAGIRSLVGLGF